MSTAFSFAKPCARCGRVGNMNFGEAIAKLKAGGRVQRSGWNGKGMWLNLQVPDAHSKMRQPYIYLRTTDDSFVPWTASQSDMLGEDWTEYVD